MKRKSGEEVNQEYKEFLKTDAIRPPQGLTDGIFNRVRADLSPSAWTVFAKLSSIHFVSGIVTLSLCPQFGVRFFGEGHGVMRYFMAFGPYGCIAACGAFFIGMSLLIAGLMLRPEEVRQIRAHRFLQLSAVTFLSLGAFIMADAEIVFGFGLAWIIGSVLGGMAMLELSWMLRRRVSHFA